MGDCVLKGVCSFGIMKKSLLEKQFLENLANLARGKRIKIKEESWRKHTFHCSNLCPEFSLLYTSAERGLFSRQS